MNEHKTCKSCKWNNYPTCRGTLFDGVEMRIDNLRPSFECGIKTEIEPKEFVSTKTESLQEKIQELESRLKKLEEI